MPADHNTHPSSPFSSTFNTPSTSMASTSGAGSESPLNSRIEPQANRITGVQTEPSAATDPTEVVIHAIPEVTRESQGSQRVVLPELPTGLTLEQRAAEALRLAQEAFAQTGYWVVFYKAILGTGGVVNKLFPSVGELDYFYGTAEFSQIQQILTALRTSDLEKADAIEPLKMLTIRIPRSMQTALMDEATRNHTSINKLCISKLLCPIHPSLVPEEQGKVKGRKPQA